ETRQVARQETNIFQQVEPGLVLVLIGETDGEGALTETRWVVTATYPVEQEVERLRSGELAAVIPPGQPGSLADGTQITVLETAMQTPDGLPSDLAYALVDLEIVTGAEPLGISRLSWTLEDTTGSRFNPDALASAQGTFGALPGEIPANTIMPVSLGFLARRDLADARLLVTADGRITAFALTFVLPPPPPTVDGLDVDLRWMSYHASADDVEARVFNAQARAVALEADSNGLVLGYTALRLGPQQPPIAGDMPNRMVTEAALDQT